MAGLVDRRDGKWINVQDRMPHPGRTLMCKIAHYEGRRREEVLLNRVDESDCDWRTADDGSELNYDWTVTHWWESE